MAPEPKHNERITKLYLTLEPLFTDTRGVNYNGYQYKDNGYHHTVGLHQYFITAINSQNPDFTHSLHDVLFALPSNKVFLHSTDLQ